MRIGTWNLAGRWSELHEEFVEQLDCDILLLTEVSDRVVVRGLEGHVGERLMAPRRHWAGIWSRFPLTPLPDPHGASVMAEIDGRRYCSSILPWRSCGRRDPWVGESTYAKTVEAVAAVEAAAPVVWGGDWNHALRGREYAGSQAGRRHIMEALDRLRLRAVTRDAPHQIDGLFSIDHVAVPSTWTVRLEHHSAVPERGRLSDHDAYVADIGDPEGP
ncbi:endonuclease/exonuclease/phosphatase family protein [Nocardioides sp.]|uniref:endonuclease/exonuclease/phosphatase family protein n=1 Tax=Nocardioides sp. TaxID=35761 RepID=UPI003513A7B7